LVVVVNTIKEKEKEEKEKKIFLLSFVDAHKIIFHLLDNNNQKRQSLVRLFIITIYILSREEGDGDDKVNPYFN
jgi:hypothetical protein